MKVLFWIIVANLIISLISLIGVFALSLKDAILNKLLLRLVALSSGALLGGAFLHLIPEGIEKIDPKIFFPLLILAIVFFLLVEKILNWRHCHKGAACDTHQSVGYMNLIGDAVHNFIDGLVIAAAFIVDVRLGLITAVAMCLHEIPQEIGDFGVLIFSGFTKKRALFYNFLSALSAIFGGIVGWALSRYSSGIEAYLLPVAAGGFIYIAASDLLPEVRKTVSLKNFFIDVLFIFIGISIILAFSLLNVG